MELLSEDVIQHYNPIVQRWLGIAEQGFNSRWTGVLLVVAAFCLLLWTQGIFQLRLDADATKGTLRLENLPAGSVTLKRLQVARQHFEAAKKACDDIDYPAAVDHLARSLEVDEAWVGSRPKEFKHVVSCLSDYLDSLSTETLKADYCANIVKAYFLIWVNGMIAQAGRADKLDNAMDSATIKDLLETAATLQPDNPKVFKLRADFCQRIPALAKPEDLVADFEKCVSLLDSRPHTDQNIGAVAQDEQQFLLAFCHKQLGDLLREKKPDSACEHYLHSIAFADPYFIHLPHCYFAAVVLTFQLMQVDSLDVVRIRCKQAAEWYKLGLKADADRKAWVPNFPTPQNKDIATTLLHQAVAKHWLDEAPSS